MIVLSRSLARQFRAVLRRLLQDADQRNQWPFVVCRADTGGLTLQARAATSACATGSRRPDPRNPDLSSVSLADIEGRTDTPVELESVDAQKGKARFNDGGVPKAVDFDLVMGNATHEWPSLPKELVQQPPEFLTALHEAARTCRPASGRFALSRVQLRGKEGEVIATDGKQLMVQSRLHYALVRSRTGPASVGVHLSGNGLRRSDRPRSHGEACRCCASAPGPSS